MTISEAIEILNNMELHGDELEALTTLVSALQRLQVRGIIKRYRPALNAMARHDDDVTPDVATRRGPR